MACCGRRPVGMRHSPGFSRQSQSARTPWLSWVRRRQRVRVTILLGCVLAVAACSNEPEIERLEPVPDAAEFEFRDPVTSVTSARRDRLPGGIIVTATGVPPSQGWWDAELVPVEEESDTRSLVFEFLVARPRFAEPSGTQQSREVVVGLFLSDQRLQGVQDITIVGAQNRRSVRP